MKGDLQASCMGFSICDTTYTTIEASDSVLSAMVFYLLVKFIKQPGVRGST